MGLWQYRMDLDSVMNVKKIIENSIQQYGIKHFTRSLKKNDGLTAYLNEKWGNISLMHQLIAEKFNETPFCINKKLKKSKKYQ